MLTWGQPPSACPERSRSGYPVERSSKVPQGLLNPFLFVILLRGFAPPDSRFDFTQGRLRAPSPRDSRRSMPKAALAAFSLSEALLTAYDTNDRINQYMIENLPAEAWRAEPPGGKGRTVAAIVAHIHNVRVMWLKAAKAEEIPEQLDRTTVTPTRAMRALESSRHALSVIISRAVDSNGRIRSFRPDVVGFVGYLIAHDAHHRGQIAMLARQLGHPLPQKTMFGMWEWGTR